MIKIIKQIISKCNRDNINDLADQITYKILLAFFPFIIFLMSLIGFFNLDQNILLNELAGHVPSQIISIVNLFISEVIKKKNISLMSSSLLISILSASSGFEALIKNINKIYSHQELEGFVLIKLTSFICEFLFAISLVLCIILIVFGNKILSLITFNINLLSNISAIIFKYSLSIIILTMLALLIYKISLYHSRNKFKHKKSHFMLPGALFCSVIWIILSLGFNFYIENFAKLSAVYGSVAGIFILMMWLNLIIKVLIIGIELNYFINSRSKSLAFFI